MTMIDPRFSTCLELLFVAEATAMHDRIRLAHAAGFRTVEFWRWSNKNLDEVDAALLETGVDLAAILAEPVLPLTDLNSHARFLEGLSSSVDVARRLGAGTLIVQAGNLLDSVPRVRQSEALVDGLRKPRRSLPERASFSRSSRSISGSTTPAIFSPPRLRGSISSMLSDAPRCGCFMTSTIRMSWAKILPLCLPDGSTASGMSILPMRRAAMNRAREKSTGGAF